jgi:hypothetical protein
MEELLCHGNFNGIFLFTYFEIAHKLMYLRFIQLKFYFQLKNKQKMTNDRICAFLIFNFFFVCFKRIVLGKDPSKVSVLFAPSKKQQKIDGQDNMEQTDKIKADKKPGRISKYRGYIVKT